MSDAPNTKVDPPTDSRHLHREDLFQQLFAWTFSAKQQERAGIKASDTIREIIAVLPELDAQIVTVAPERPIAGINRVDLAILRTILWEARTKKTPKKVLVDEGIELAKAYGSDHSAQFVNATLARLLLDETPPSQI